MLFQVKNVDKTFYNTHLAGFLPPKMIDIHTHVWLKTSIEEKGGDGPLLMVGFNRRFAPLARRLHSFLADRREPLVAHYRVNAGFLQRYLESLLGEYSNVV